MSEHCKKNRVAPLGVVAMGTEVMISAGIFSLTGKIGRPAGPTHLLPFVVTAFIASIQITMSNAFVATAWRK